ncbi:MAG: hypothetical protein GY835_10735 [bacterium]|nr:hypothetical protein [bacterium]
MKSVMSLPLILAVLVSSGVQAELPLTPGSHGSTGEQYPRDTLHHQNPDYDGTYNVSSGFDAEIVDDIPVELAGSTVNKITFWVGEWYAPWRNPIGININFYLESCPPELDLHIGYLFTWDQLIVNHVHSGLATVYEVTAALPVGLTISEGMSIGGQVVIDWGHDEPFAGLCSTAEWDIHGCEAYLDATWWGYDRWTSTAAYTQIPRDFAYDIDGLVTGVTPQEPAGVTGLESRPNPFNPKTTFHFTLLSEQYVKLGIVDATGRRVATICEDTLPAGDHSLSWSGQDQSGRALAAGVYCGRLETGGQVHSLKLVLVK